MYRHARFSVKSEQSPPPSVCHCGSNNRRIQPGRICKRCVSKRADACIIGPDVRFGKNSDTTAFLIPPANHFSVPRKGGNLCGNRQAPKQHHQTLQSPDRNRIRTCYSIHPFRKSCKGYDKHIQQMGMITIEKISAGRQSTQRLPIFKPHSLLQFADSVYIWDRNQIIQQPAAYFPGEGIPYIWKIRAYLFFLYCSSREIILKQIFIYNGFTLLFSRHRQASPPSDPYTDQMQTPAHIPDTACCIPPAPQDAQSSSRYALQGLQDHSS